MKKTLIFVALILVTSVFVSAKDFTVTLYGDYFSVADTGYKETYGGEKYFPELKITYRYKGNFYLWGGFGYLPANFKWDKWSNKGVVLADLKMKNASNKLFLSAGLGYWLGYIDQGQLAIKTELGFCSTYNAIEITENNIFTQKTTVTSESKKWGIGLRGNFGISYGLTKKMFTEASIGYMYVWAKEDKETINAGGLRLALGLGLKL